MSNVLFYTFSTIAQTLSGAVALLGAFVLYRLQSLGSEMTRASLGAIQPYAGEQNIQLLHISERFDELSSLLNERRPPKLGPVGTIGYAHLDKLDRFLEERRETIRLFRLVLITTGGLVVASVLVLALTPTLSCAGVASTIALVVAFAWLLVCFGLMARLIWRSVQ